MKPINPLFLFVSILFTCCSYSQEVKLISPTLAYESDLDGKLFNAKMLNILFSNKVGTAFGGSNDLSLQKFYTSLDVSDTSLSIGANIDSRGSDETKQLIWVFSGGFKIKSKDKFAVVYKDGDFQEDNIGATLKVSLIGNGIINFKPYESTTKKKLREEAVKENRKILFKKYDSKVEKFNREELKDFADTKTILSKYDDEVKTNTIELKEKENELYIAMAKEEIDYLEKNKMYRFLWNHWYSFEAFVPFGENNYKTTNDPLTNPLKDNKFYALNATLSGNTMWQFSSGESIFIKAKLNLKNNNNIIVDNLSSVPFQTTSVGPGGIMVISNSDDGYLTDFNQFLTTSITLEPAFFTLNNTIGFSPAVEFNQGKYKKRNWKLGIPISLKDKDGKPKVNFEVQWKEVNTLSSSIHIVGISANYLFGELIN